MMVLCTWVNGVTGRNTVRGNRGGLIAQCIRESGRLTWPTVKESLSTQMAILTKETGLTIRQMEMVPTFMRTTQNMWANGSTTCNTDRERNPGLMVQDMLAAIMKVKNTDKDSCSLGMEVIIRVNLSRMIFMAKESISGLIKKSTKEAGSTTKCPAKENIGGQMGATLKVIIKMIKNTVSESSSGPMVASTRENGSLVSNTEKATIQIKTAKKEKVFGSVQRGCVGSMIRK